MQHHLIHVSKLHQRSDLDCSLSHYIYLILCQVRQISTFCHTFPIHTHGKCIFSDGIGKILFVTPSNGCKIRLTRKSTGSQMKIKEGTNVVRWYLPIPIFRMESDGVHGNPTESIHVHRNHQSCGKPDLRQVQYKRNMARSLSHEAKELILSANNGK